MQPEQYAKMRSEEKLHWWYRGNRKAVRALLARRWREHRLPRWLDVACGTGGNLAEPERLIGRSAQAFGLDLEPAALALTRSRGVPHVVRATLDDLPFAEGSFDLVTCFEALYHQGVPNWPDALAGFARVLAPGGFLLSREPAFAALRGSHDVVVQGARRFRRAQLTAGMRAAGLEVVRCSYQNIVTFFPALVIRSWQRRHGLAPAPEHQADFAKGGGGLVGSLLTGWLALEGHILRALPLPFGSSVICLARRPVDHQT